MRRYTVHFDRIGRTYRDRTVVFEARNSADLAEAIHRHARTKLVSHDTDVSVDATPGGRVYIGAGRLGSGTVTKVEEAQA